MREAIGDVELRKEAEGYRGLERRAGSSESENVGDSGGKEGHDHTHNRAVRKGVEDDELDSTNRRASHG